MNNIVAKRGASWEQNEIAKWTRNKSIVRR